MSDIKVEKTIFLKIQQDVRLPFSKINLKKTGHNSHLGYDYFTLDDFLPKATELLANAGLCTIFNIDYDSNGIEMAKLAVTDGMNTIEYHVPTSNVPRMEGIFETGSKITYCKRYLYMNLLELTEPDAAEISNTGEPEKTEKKKAKATEKQINMIRSNYDEENIAKMLEYYNIQSLEELDIETASKVIERKVGKK